MTLTERRPAADSPVSTDTRRRVAPLAALYVVLLILIALIASVHIVQGTARVGVAELWSWAFGGSTGQATAVVVDSRLPRLAAGVLIGIALGAAGAVMQSLSRNLLASPDTLAVNSGAVLALAAGGVFGIGSANLFGSAGLAFAGGLAAAVIVLALTGTEWGTVRLVLAGSAVALLLDALAIALIILFPLDTVGISAWAAGSLSQNGITAVRTFTPVVVVGVLALLVAGRRLDLMAVGDDHARSLGVPVRRTQLVVLVLAVLLTAAAVTVTGPIGFLGLAAPALVRLGSRHVPGLHRHRALIPVSALTAVVVVLGADVVLRWLIGAQRAVEVPTGIITSLLGAVFLVALSYRLRSQISSRFAVALEVRGSGTHRFALLLAVLLVVAVAAVVTGMLIGDSRLLLGDLANWITGQAGPRVSFVLDNRVPRVLAAFLAGVALAVAGLAIQAVTRNPLAEPAILGVSGGASVGAVLVVTFVPAAGFTVLAGAAGIGALIAAGIVFGLAARSGFASDRLVLIGVGVAAAAGAIVTLLIVVTDPWNASKALTWLSGSTYGRTFEHLVPLLIAVVLLVPLLATRTGDLDLLSVDDDTPRVLGLRLGPSRVVVLLIAVFLTATAVSAIGVIGFVGLVAPHAARTLVGRRHRRALPVTLLLGGTLVVLADLVGRSVIAPGQLPAGLLTAVVGAPYFFWLMYRSRRPV